MIQIYNQEFFLAGKIKSFAKKILGKIFGGPYAVQRSLMAGLQQLHTEFAFNQQPHSGDIACVLSGVPVLRWALEQKRRGVLKNLIAGPNIVITPHEYGGLVTSDLIDTYVVPSQWSLQWWVSMQPSMKNKLRVWPAGVQDQGVFRNSSGYCLIYQKTVPTFLVNHVCEVLGRFGISYKLLRYGTRSHEEYLSMLRGAAWMIYLTEHESQGLALHEAWMGDIPTLVWDPGKFAYSYGSWQAQNISAPFLTAACGISFNSTNDFEARLVEFLGTLDKFTPREYSLQNFTDKKSAEIYLNIIKQTDL